MNYLAKWRNSFWQAAATSNDIEGFIFMETITRPRCAQPDYSRKVSLIDRLFRFFIVLHP